MSSFTDKAKQLATLANDIATSQENLDSLHDQFEQALAEYHQLMPTQTSQAPSTQQQEDTVSQVQTPITMKG